MKTKLDEDFSTRLLLLLLTKGLLNGDQLASAQANGGDLPEQYLIEQGWVTREQMAEASAASFGLEAISPDFLPLPEALPQELMEKYQVVPVERRGDALLVAVAAPTPSKVTAELAKTFGGPIHFIISDRLTLAEKLAPEPVVEPEPEPAPEVQEDEPLIGGRYRKGDRFLDGRFSILYKGQDERTGLPVAIRHLESYFTSEDARTQTLREGRTLAKLRHPNLPRIRQLVSHQNDRSWYAATSSSFCRSSIFCTASPNRSFTVTCVPRPSWSPPTGTCAWPSSGWPKWERPRLARRRHPSARPETRTSPPLSSFWVMPAR